MLKYFVVALGGAIGALGRYLISGNKFPLAHNIFPVSTLIVNATGSCAIGFIFGLMERFTVSPNARIFIFIGILGGYTTFSTFSMETFNLIRDGEHRMAMLNVFFSALLSIGGVFLGYFESKLLMNSFK